MLEHSCFSVMLVSTVPQNESATRIHTTSVSSIVPACPTLCHPMDCSTPGFPVHLQLPELAQTHVHPVGDAVQPSHPVVPFSSRLQSFPASGAFPMSHIFTSGGQSIGVSASASGLPVNIQDWSPLGLTGWVSLQSYVSPPFWSSFPRGSPLCIK